MKKLTLLEKMIIEGRLNNVEKKFPLLALKHNGKSLIDRFSKEDPSGNNKYLAWMTDAFQDMLIRYAGDLTKGKGFEKGGNIDSIIEKIYKENLPSLVGDEPYPTGFVKHAEKIIEAVSQFHTLLPHIKTKDIYSYEVLEDLIQAIEDAKNKKKMADQKKAIKQGAKSGGAVVYENEYGLTVVRVDTTKAACFFGQGTRWCIAARIENQFENYTNQGYVFYYVLNPKHEDRDNQKFAVLFNPGWSERDRVVHTSEPLPVVEIFDAADDSIGSSTMFSALVETGVLGDPMAAAKDTRIPRSKTVHGVFDTMLNTLSVHADRNPAKQALTSYAIGEFEDREGNQEFDASFKNVQEAGEDGTMRQERSKTAVRMSKQIILNVPMGVFANLMKALVTATGGQKIQTAPGQKLPEFNKQFYTKLRDQYIDKATSVAEEQLKEFLTKEEMPKVNEEQGKLFGDEESKNFISQVRIKDVRFWTENEKRLSIGDKATAFDDAMISLARQWEGNPVAMGDVFGKDGMTKYTLKELYQFARQRYALSFHFMVEMFPKDAKVLTKDKAVPSNIPVPLVPSPEQPQYYILSDRKAVKRFVEEVEWIEEYFIGYGFDRALRRALEESDLYTQRKSRRPARRVKGMRQQGFDFEGTGLKPDRIKSDAPGSRRRVTVDETLSRWNKIIKG